MITSATYWNAAQLRHLNAFWITVFGVFGLAVSQFNAWIYIAHLHRRYISVMALCSIFLNLHLLFFVCLTIEALGVAKPSVASYLSQEILAEQEADRVHGLPAQPPVKFNNMVVISLSMKLKEEHCSIGFSRPLTNQNKNPFFYGSMEVLFF